jgi:hypothetical protein
VLNEENIAHYKLSMEVPVKIADRAQYVINMEPEGIQLYPIMKGRVFIDQETLTFTRAELQLDMRDWRAASDYMLVHKPFGLRFRPRELTMTIVYNTDEQGIAHMSYVRNEMRFNCDWKRRLFASPFTTVCEMVVTDRQQKGDGDHGLAHFPYDAGQPAPRHPPPLPSAFLRNPGPPDRSGHPGP